MFAVARPELVRVTLTNFEEIVSTLSLEFDQKVIKSNSSVYALIR